jgi:hypothetical protein
MLQNGLCANNTHNYVQIINNTLTSRFTFIIQLPQDPESQAEYPKIEHKFHVEFKFLELPYEPCTASPVPSVPTMSITSPEEEDSKTVLYSDIVKSNKNESGRFTD